MFKKILRNLCLSLFLLSLTTVTASAATYYWVGGVSSYCDSAGEQVYDNPTCWSNSVDGSPQANTETDYPDSGDVATFDTNNASVYSDCSLDSDDLDFGGANDVDFYLRDYEGTLDFDSTTKRIDARFLSYSGSATVDMSAIVFSQAEIDAGDKLQIDTINANESASGVSYLFPSQAPVNFYSSFNYSDGILGLTGADITSYYSTFSLPVGATLDLSDVDNLEFRYINITGDGGSIIFPEEMTITYRYSHTSGATLVDFNEGTVYFTGPSSSLYGIQVEEGLSLFNNVVVEKDSKNDLFGFQYGNTADTLEIMGDLTINKGQIDFNTAPLKIHGDFYFNPDTNFAYYDSYSQTYYPKLELAGVSNVLSGDIRCNTFTKDTTVSSTLTLPSGTNERLEITGATFIHGTSTATLNLVSDSPGTQWDFYPEGSLDLEYLSVQDSNNLSTNNPVIYAYSYVGVDDAETNPNNTGWLFAAPPSDPSNLGPSEVIDGSAIKDTTPSFDFTLSHSGDVKYRIQVWEHDNSDTLVVDYTSDFDTDGVKSFTVGQDPGDGSYTVGSPGQVLDSDDDQEYYWQVQAINDEGGSSNWVDAKSGDFGFYLDFVGPAPVTLLSPKDGDISTLQPTFTWEDLADEVKYTLEISDDPNFATYVQRIDNIPQNSTSVQASSALSSGLYYWRIWGTDNLSNEDPAAAIINAEDFYAGPHSPEIPVITGTTQAINGSNTINRKPRFDFFLDDLASGAWLKFRVQVASDSEFNTLVLDYTSNYRRQSTLNTQYLVGSVEDGGSWKYPADFGEYTVGSAGMELSDGAYYWRVLAKNETADSDWAVANGGSVAFYVDNAPDAPSDLGPTELIDGSYSTNHDLVFEFLTSSPGYQVDLYHTIEIDNDSDFSSPEVVYTSELLLEGNKTFTLGQASGGGTYIVGSEGQTLADGTYYWRVKVENDQSVESAYTEANGFGAFVVNTEVPDVPVNLDSPSFDAQDKTTDSTPQLNFDLGSATVDLPLAYRVQIDDSSGFDSLLIDYTSAKSSQGTLDFTIGQAEGSGTYDVNEVSELDPGVYYWRVKAINNPESDWGDGGSFEVEDGGPVLVPEFSDYMLILIMLMGAGFILNQRYQLIKVHEK